MTTDIEAVGTRRMTRRARQSGAGRGGVRLMWLYLASRRVPVAAALIAGCAIGLRIALHWHWDTYGALQLPLMFESGCAAVIAITTMSPFGDADRATGRWLPYLRLASTLALTGFAVIVLAGTGMDAPLAGGTLDVLRNMAGLTGIGLLCALLLGGSLAWTGPTAYLLVGTYALYTDWHPPTVTTPWIWPARPPHDLGGALCAGLVFAAGLLAITIRGARDVDR
jgi:hypothetical protein